METADESVDQDRAPRDEARHTLLTADQFRQMFAGLGEDDPAAYLVSRPLLDDVNETSRFRLSKHSDDASFAAKVHGARRAWYAKDGSEHHGYPRLIEKLASPDEPTRSLWIQTQQFCGIGIVSIATGRLLAVAFNREAKGLRLSTDELRKMLRASVESEACQAACKPLLDDLADDDRIILHMSAMDPAWLLRTYTLQKERMERLGMEHGGYEESIAAWRSLDHEVWGLFVGTQRFHGSGAVSVRTGRLVTLMYVPR